MKFELIVKKTIPLKPNIVYNAFTEADIWSQWFSANTHVDLRQGGRFSNADGDTGEYLEIIPNKLLRFTWECVATNTEVKLSFLPVGNDSTELTLQQTKLCSQEDVDKMTQCWTWTLDNLSSFLTTGRVIPLSVWKKTQIL